MAHFALPPARSSRAKIVVWLFLTSFVSFYDRKLSFTATRQRKMIQVMPTNRVITILIHSDKTHFQNVFVVLLRRVAKDVTSSLLSWHKRYDFNAANVRRYNQ